MKGRYKKVTLFTATLILAFIGITGSALAYQDIRSKAIQEEWTYIDDNYYSLVNVDSTHLLIKRIQNRDIQEIEEKLIDNNRTQDVVSARTLMTDPYAVGPDNMLPDGSFLVENWEDLQLELYNAKHEIKRLSIRDNTTPTLSSVNELSRFALPVFADGVDLRHVITENSSVYVPSNFDDVSTAFAIAPSKEYTLFTSDRDMKSIDAQGVIHELSPSTFEGKTYEQLAKESIELYGENNLFWNGQSSISPDSSCVAYVSNKADLQGTWDLYMLDVKNGAETLIANDPIMHYGIIQWVNDDYLLCSKTHDTEYTWVIVGKNGEEYGFNLTVDKPVFLGSRNGIIAYGNEENNVIFFVKFDGTSLTRISEVHLDGTFRVRPGIDPFSPDGLQFAYIFVPRNNPYGRDITIVNLNNAAKIRNKYVPIGTKNNTAILEFSWLDNGSLLTSVIENESQEISSWIYHTN